jgi:hypothetical protein
MADQQQQLETFKQLMQPISCYQDRFDAEAKVFVQTRLGADVASVIGSFLYHTNHDEFIRDFRAFVAELRRASKTRYIDALPKFGLVVDLVPFRKACHRLNRIQKFCIMYGIRTDYRAINDTFVYVKLPFEISKRACKLIEKDNADWTPANAYEFDSDSSDEFADQPWDYPQYTLMS